MTKIKKQRRIKRPKPKSTTKSTHLPVNLPSESIEQSTSNKNNNVRFLSDEEFDKQCKLLEEVLTKSEKMIAERKKQKN
jgi:hypothetical protein